MRRFASLFILSVALPAPFASRADGLWPDEAYSAFCSRLEATSQQTLAARVGQFLPTLRAQGSFSPDGARTARFADMEPLLARAARHGWSVLEMFTQPEFTDPAGCALFLDERTLADINRKFNLHGLWQIAAPLAEGRERTLHMSYLIVGQGRLVIGYPRSAVVEINDGEAVTGKYNYEPYISARIESSQHSRGLFDIRALPSPAAPFEPFVGPYGVQITALQMEGSDILVRYTWGIGQTRRTRNVPITQRGYVAASR